MKIQLGLYVFFLLILVMVSCKSNPFEQGEALYIRHCSDCHMQDGTGLRGLIPPLANADHLENYNLNTICYILNGLKDTITVNGKEYNEEMLPIKGLEAAELTNIMNYINQSWGNDFGFVNYMEVEKRMKSCLEDSQKSSK